MTMQNSIFQDVFETDPLGRRALFESFAPTDLRTPFQQEAFSGMFDRILNNFLGTLGTQVRSGQSPALRFSDFLDQQDFGRQLRRAPSFQTGRQTSPLVSAARFLFER